MDIFQSKRKIFSKIYDKYVDKIYRFVFLKVSSQEIAQDLTSETFLRGWRAFEKSINQKIGTKSQIKNPQAFLYKIARNLVIDYYRERDRASIVSIEDKEIIDPGLNSEEKAFLDSDLRLISQSLAELKDDYQDIIIWHYVDGLSFREIAKILTKSEGSIRVMTHRALKDLREKIEER